MNSHSRPLPAVSAPSRRTERRRLEARTRVFEAASDLFAANGFFETSMASIAERADVAVGTLYNLFQSKDALYGQLVNRKTAEFSERLIAALGETDDPAKAVERFVETMFELYCEEAPMLRLYYRMSGSHVSVRAAFDDNSQNVFEVTLVEFAKVIQRGIDAGKFDLGIDARRAALAIQAVANELFGLYVRESSQRTGDAELKEVLAMIRHGILPARIASIPGPEPATNRTQE